MQSSFLTQIGCGSFGASTDETSLQTDRPFKIPRLTSVRYHAEVWGNRHIPANALNVSLCLLIFKTAAEVIDVLVVYIENKDPTHSINKVKNQVYNR